MFKSALFCLLLLVALTGSNATAENLLDGAESVAFDSLNNRYLVSSCNSHQIISVDIDGNQSVFVSGVSFPLGNHIVNNVLYVSTGAVLKGYDITTAEEVFSLWIPEGQQLDGMTADTSGYLYVVDGPKRKIFKVNLAAQTYTTFVSSGLPMYPQDATYDQKHNRILVASYQDMAPIQAVDLADSTVTIVANSVGRFDGITMDPEGNVYLSVSNTGEVIMYDTNFFPFYEVIANGYHEPSGLDYNPRDHILAVPTFAGDTIHFLRVGPAFTRITEGEIATDAGESQAVSWVDYDGDGYDDLFVSNNGYPTAQNNSLYHNEGDGSFSNVGSGALTADGSYSRGAGWADFDNDGDPDCYVANHPAQENLLYRNDGGGLFEMLTGGEPTELAFGSQSPAWADYDNDGFLDLFVTNSSDTDPAGLTPCANALYRSDGGTLTRVSTGGDIVTDIAHSRGASWADYDSDGDLDLFVANSEGENNSLYEYNGDGTFTSITGGPVVTDGGESYGGSWGDIDNDGDLDLFVTNVGYSTAGNNFLYKNDGAGNFTAMLMGAVVSDGGCSLGSCFGDYDNDGDLDLFVANDDFGGNSVNFLYENNGSGVFSRVTKGVAASDIGASCGAAFADYDRDGDLDLAVANAGTGDQLNPLYQNNARGNNWLVINCVGSASNRSAIGARVKIRSTVNFQSVRKMREISSQTGYCGQGSLNVHFGLGQINLIDSLTIEWPSGMVETVTDVAVNQYLTIVEGDLGDTDADGVVDLFDNCPEDYNPDQADGDGDGVGDVCASCCEQKGDFNHDGRVDVSDIVAWVNWSFNGNPQAPMCEYPDGFYVECDMDNSDQVDVADVVFWVNWSFNGGTAPEGCL